MAEAPFRLAQQTYDPAIPLEAIREHPGNPNQGAVGRRQQQRGKRTPMAMSYAQFLARKAAQADAMFTALVGHMADADSIARDAVYERDVQVPPWVR